MAEQRVTGAELDRLFSQVFCYAQNGAKHRFCFIVDVPRTSAEDTTEWRERRSLARAWANELSKTNGHTCCLFAYENVGRSNADLIRPTYEIPLDVDIPDVSSELKTVCCHPVPFDSVYGVGEYWIALTQYSATAPLKMAAIRYGFKAATMPGFSLAMLPALFVDIDVVHERVTRLARALTRADSARLVFEVWGCRYELTIDLRRRMGFVSSGRFMNAGQAGNLPSGEAYIVPYEGEKHDVVSQTNGILPLQRGSEVALCEVSENRVVCIEGDHAWGEDLRAFISADPARANIAELGLGVLGDFGVEAVGSVLLDEKLATHIALGRSEHLGGVTSPSDFLAPENVCHIDYVFHRSLQPDVHMKLGELRGPWGKFVFVENDKYIYDNLMND